jgi:putative oxidoreductase
MMAQTAVSTHHHPAPGLRVRLTAGLEWLARFPIAIHLLLFRLAVGSLFFKAGQNKFASWETTVALFRDEYKVPVFSPEVAAVMGTSVELGCSTLLVLGLATRLATLPLLGMLAVIQLFVYPQAWTDHLLYGSILAILLTRGPGAISLDRLIGLESRESAGS